MGTCTIILFDMDSYIGIHDIILEHLESENDLVMPVLLPGSNILEKESIEKLRTNVGRAVNAVIGQVPLAKLRDASNPVIYRYVSNSCHAAADSTQWVRSRSGLLIQAEKGNRRNVLKQTISDGCLAGKETLMDA